MTIIIDKEDIVKARKRLSFQPTPETLRANFASKAGYEELCLTADRIALHRLHLTERVLVFVPSDVDVWEMIFYAKLEFDGTSSPDIQILRLAPENEQALEQHRRATRFRHEGNILLLATDGERTSKLRIPFTLATYVSDRR